MDGTTSSLAPIGIKWATAFKDRSSKASTCSAKTVFCLENLRVVDRMDFVERINKNF